MSNNFFCFLHFERLKRLASRLSPRASAFGTKTPRSASRFFKPRSYIISAFGAKKKDRMRMDDRLSGLQDDLILQVLSFVGLKDAIRTSVLSSRWRFMWTSIPHLDFSSEDFSTMDMLYNFVTHVLSCRNNQVQLSSVNLYLHGKDGHDVAQRIMNLAFSLNAQKLNITCLFGNYTCLPRTDTGSRLFLSGSQTLKHLSLRRASGYDHFILASIGEFSSLTTLHLYYIILYDGFLSNCPNLENLTLNCCKMTGSKVLRICHPRLSNLTLEKGNLKAHSINVVTPQLKYLTISHWFGGFQISAPELAFLLFRGDCPYIFSTEGFHSLEKAQLSLHIQSRSDAPVIISLLQKLHNVKCLSLSLEIIKLLNSSLELISHQPPPFANLKSLKILPKVFCFGKHKHTRATMSTDVYKFLLNSSPKATLTEVQQEQCCDQAAGAALGSIV